MAPTQHSAAGQALGYVHQVGWGLLELVRPGGPDDYELRLETVDDVSWHDAAGDPLRALQVKHHAGGGGTLTEASPDLWRTVAVWLDDPVLLDPDGPALVLTTTQAVAAGSALSLLGPQDRRPDDARDLLDRAAGSSKNETTRRAREGWLGLPDAVRSGLCDRLTVVWEQGTADDRGRDLSGRLLVQRGDSFANCAKPVAAPQARVPSGRAPGPPVGCGRLPGRRQRPVAGTASGAPTTARSESPC